MVTAQNRSYIKVLDSLSKNVIQADYAVRGQIPLRGEQINKLIEQAQSQGSDQVDHTALPFSSTTALNIGNP